MGLKNKVLAGVFIIGCVVIIGVASIIGITSKEKNNDKVTDNGVTIVGTGDGGMTEEEAKEVIGKYVEELMVRPVKIIINDNTVDTTFGELGFSYDDSASAQEALQEGNQYSFIRHIFKPGGGETDGDIEYKLSFTVDNDVLRNFVEDKCTVFNVKAKNSLLKYKKNGKFKATKDHTGQKVQVDETISRIISTLEGSLYDGTIEIEAVVKTVRPRYTRETISKCKDMIGSYSTSFASSSSTRANNIQVAAKYINGTILYPGQTFSTIKVIKDRTEANGYQSAPEYSSGKVVDGIGGGVCQVSTTLYNAVLNAELSVVERSPHSMVVAYVDVSRDAAISGDYKDFKFKNNTDAPVYIKASADGGYLSFKIYGEETRDKNRKIEYVSEVLETIQPGADIITEDKSLPSS